MDKRAVWLYNICGRALGDGPYTIGGNMQHYIISYDVGTTGVKTCLFSVDKTIDLVSAKMAGYKLYVLENGGAEQHPDEWWSAMCTTTQGVLQETGIDPKLIEGVSFCSQMQALVLVDKDMNAVRPAMSYMDQRAKEEIKKGIAHGFQIAGANVIKLLKSLYYTGAVSASVKDPVWKYKWVEAHEPEVFKKADKWLDVKEYLIGRATGNAVMTEDSAFATLIYDIHKKTWSKPMCKMFGVNPNHLATIKKSTDCVGTVTQSASNELGLAVGTKVFGGGGDASLIGVGAGSTRVGDTHIYSGTSGWVGTVVDKSMVDTSAMIAAIVGAESGKYNYFAEMETSGKCLEWVRDHLALDEIGIYLEKKHITEDIEKKYTSLYDYMTYVCSKAPAGSGGVIFTPWLHGNRCPFEDPSAKGMFFNISLETGKTELIRAVLEGICYHKRWMLEAEARKAPISDVIRFVGGGALSEFTCQLLADITGHTIETVKSPQNVGAVGAAAVVAVGLNIIGSLDDLKDFIPAEKTFVPNKELKAVYDKNFTVFKNLYKANKKNFAILNN